MTNEERDDLIIEMHTDIKWLKQSNIEHKATHAKYIYLTWSTVIGLVITLTVVLIR